jgi:hypothetical protein
MGVRRGERMKPSKDKGETFGGECGVQFFQRGLMGLPIARITIEIQPGVGVRLVVSPFGPQAADTLPIVEVFPADGPKPLPAKTPGAPPRKKKRVR